MQPLYEMTFGDYSINDPFRNACTWQAETKPNNVILFIPAA
ncbi:hypothetical protein [Terrimonas ginsenosidimutans]|nr:hypothetical protein [Terrimonas ginsenosidimutans]